MGTKLVNMSRRTVWLGLTMPGKKMMKMLGARWSWRYSPLIDLYQGEPTKALLAAAMALHVLPERGQFGPAFRDLLRFRRLETWVGVPRAFHGAILTDIRDFLKLRFRAKGLSKTGGEAPKALEETIRAGNIQAAFETSEAEIVVSYVVNYVITALDTLSRDPAISGIAKGEEFVNSVHRLRDLLRGTARWFYFGRYDFYDRYIDTLFQD